MLSYMDYIQRCFYSTTLWNSENSYESILSTSRNLLNFNIPNNFKVNISCKNTDYSYSSVTLSQLNRLTGSVAYMYCTTDLKDNYQASKHLPLQSVLEGYRLVQPQQYERYDERPTLLYGKMYFPSQFLEGMLVKRLSQNSQLMVKFINTPKLNKLSKSTGIVTLYYQRQTNKSSHDFIFSTNEALFGFRTLYNIGNPSESSPTIKDSSLLSIGCELWYASQSMSPGLSTALRYSTHLSSSGKPLTMTLAINPLLGTIESTYAIKTGLASTFISKYDFNIYSYESNLSLGCDLWRYGADESESSSDGKFSKGKYRQIHNERPLADIPLVDETIFPKKRNLNFNKLGQDEQELLLNNFMQVKPGKWMLENNSRHFINAFTSSNFKSSFKCSTSLSKKDINVLWEGKFKDWLLTTGVKIDLKENVPRLFGYGLELQFSS